MSQHFVWLDLDEEPTTVEANANKFITIQNPHYNKKMLYWEGDLVINGTINSQVDSDVVGDLIYHPGEVVDAIVFLAWIGGLALSTVSLAQTATNHVRNVKNLAEAGVGAGIPLAVAQGITEIGASSGGKIKNLGDVWHYLTDINEFPEEGYYAVEESQSAVLVAKGKIHRWHLKDYVP
jgi:hypothetical protein